jgi:5-methylthioadenosine/S-adenosylhomocysteine deaminase
VATKEYAADRGIRRSAHVAEYRGVLEAVARRYGTNGAVTWLNEIGALGPDLLAVHAVQVSAQEVDILAESGAAVSHNPFSNLFCGDRNAPVSDYLSHQMPVGLGTDGAANNNGQTILDALRITRLLQRSHPTDPEAISPLAALRMATIGGAEALGIGDITGSLEVGKRADITLARIGTIAHTVPLHDLVLQVTHSLKSSDVDTVIVDGTVVVDDGRMTCVEEASILADAQQAATALVSKLG